MSLATWRWISSLRFHHFCSWDFINQKEIQKLGHQLQGSAFWLLQKKVGGFFFLAVQEFDLELEKLYSKATHLCWGNLFWELGSTGWFLELLRSTRGIKQISLFVISERQTQQILGLFQGFSEESPDTDSQMKISSGRCFNLEPFQSLCISRSLVIRDPGLQTPSSDHQFFFRWSRKTPSGFWNAKPSHTWKG